jgi:hypothetical protein
VPARGLGSDTQARAAGAENGEPAIAQCDSSIRQGAAGLSVVIERQDAPNAGWIRIAGPIDGTTASDYPPAGSMQVRYRIAYVSASGDTGDPSDPVALANSGSGPSAGSH